MLVCVKWSGRRMAEPPTLLIVGFDASSIDDSEEPNDDSEGPNQDATEGPVERRSTRIRDLIASMNATQEDLLSGLARASAMAESAIPDFGIPPEFLDQQHQLPPKI